MSQRNHWQRCRFSSITEIEMNERIFKRTVLESCWEFEARTGTVGKLRFSTFRLKETFRRRKTTSISFFRKTVEIWDSKHTFVSNQRLESEGVWTKIEEIIKIYHFAQTFSTFFESHSTFPSSGCKIEVFGRWMPYGWMLNVMNPVVASLIRTRLLEFGTCSAHSFWKPGSCRKKTQLAQVFPESG